MVINWYFQLQNSWNNLFIQNSILMIIYNLKIDFELIVDYSWSHYYGVTCTLYTLYNSLNNYGYCLNANKQLEYVYSWLEVNTICFAFVAKDPTIYNNHHWSNICTVYQQYIIKQQPQLIYVTKWKVVLH